MNKSKIGWKLSLDRALAKHLWQQVIILLGILVLLFGLSALFLSWSGYNWDAFCEAKNLNKWLLPLYLLIDTNALNNVYIDDGEQRLITDDWFLVASTITYVLGVIVFSGMIISVMTTFLTRRIHEHRAGLIHYLKSGHHIILGYDDMVPSIINSIFDNDTQKKEYVLLMTSTSIDAVTAKLSKFVGEENMNRVIINYGHRISSDYYTEIHLEKAEEIFIVGNRTLSSHDAVNIECVDSIKQYLRFYNDKYKPQQLPSRITCVFEDLDTYGAFKTSEIFEEFREMNIEFVPYNVYSGWAKQVFVNHFHIDRDGEKSRIEYPLVYGKGISDTDEKYVHLVFVGTTYFSVAFAMEAAQVLHFPNFDDATGMRRTRITFIDLNADKEKNVFITRNRHFFEVQPYIYRDLSDDSKNTNMTTVWDEVVFTEKKGYSKDDSNFLDIEFEFIKGDIFSHGVQDELRKWANEHTESGKQYLSIFLAMANQRNNFAIGMNMPDEIYDNKVPIFIRQDRSDNFITDLREADRNVKNIYRLNNKGTLKEVERNLRYANIYPFGMNESCFTVNQRSLVMAKLINYLYCTMGHDNHFLKIEELEEMDLDKLMEEANQKWKGDCQTVREEKRKTGENIDVPLTVALKWSNIYNAYNIRCKQASLRVIRGVSGNDEIRELNDSEMEMLAKVEHNRWNVEKLLLGYRKPYDFEDALNKQNESAMMEMKQNKKLFIHHDIRPFSQLDEGEKDIDRELTKYIPWLDRTTNALYNKLYPQR